MKMLKQLKNSEILIRTAGILAILMCMVFLILSANITNNKLETTQEQVDLANVAALTMSNTEDLSLDISATRGGSALEENGVVYEGEYIKFYFKATNTTETPMENVKIVATIPEGVEYGELISDFEKKDQPYYYNYEFEQPITEKTIDLGTIEAGKTKTGYYEVHVKDLESVESKDIVTNINSYIGNNLAQSYTIKNTIRPSDTQLFLGAYTEKNVGKYGLFIKSENVGQEEVQVKLHLPQIYKLMYITEIPEGIKEFGIFQDSERHGQMVYIQYEASPENADLQGINSINAEISDDNILTATLKTNELYTFTGNIETVIMEKETTESKGTIISYAEIPEKGIMSNENRMKVGFQNIEVTMTSENSGEEVKVGDKINYEIEVKNIGQRKFTETSLGLADYVKVNITDFIPEGVKPLSVTYNDWEVNDITKEVDGKPVSIGEEMVKVEDKTIDISGTPYDSDGNQLANVDVNLKIPRGETAKINVNAEAGMVYSVTEVSNTATARGDEITEKVTNEISHTILPYNYDQEILEPDDGEGEIQKAPTPAPTSAVQPSVTPTNNPTTEPTIKPSTTPVGQSNTNVNKSNTNTQNVDFKIDKYISKVTVQTSSGTKQNVFDNEKLAKVEIRAKEMQGAIVTVEYKIVVTNVGTVAGTIERVIDNLPNGLSLANNTTENKDWKKVDTGDLVNTSKANAIIKPGESATLTLIATKQMTTDSTGTFKNKATIGNIVATNKQADTNKDNDTAVAELIISVSTGAYVYISIAVVALIALILVLAVLYKAGKLNIKKILKFGKNVSVILIFTIVLLMNNGVNAITWNMIDSYDFVAYDHPQAGTVNGSCIAHDIWMQAPFYESYIISAGGWTYSKTFIETVTPVILTNDPNELIHSSINGENIKYGPFNFSAQNCDSGTYKVTAFDANNNLVAEKTLDTSEESASQFYFEIPKDKCYEGISRVHLEASGTRVDRYLYKWTRNETWGGSGGPFLDGHYGADPQPVTCNPTVPEEKNENKQETKSVEWTNLTVCLEVMKVDKDNPQLALPGVSIKITGPSLDDTYVTDENGKIGPIEDILPGNYTFTEIEVPQYGYFPDINLSVTTKTGQMVVLSLENEKQTGNLLLRKQNEDSKSELKGFEFKLQNSKGEYVIAVDKTGVRDRVEGYIRLEDLQTTTNIDEATTFVTDENGEIGIYNILIDKYTILEISEGDNLYFEATDKDFIYWSSNMGEGTGNDPIQIEVARQTSMDTESEIDNPKVDEIVIGNKQKYVDIAGLVWDEGLVGKNSDVDYMYNEEPDHLVDNVIVRVIDKTTGEVATNRFGNKMEMRTGEEPEYHIEEQQNAETETENNQNMESTAVYGQGRYYFEKLEIDKLKDYYVEFIYNGMCYQSVPVETFLNNKDIPNVSRASEDGALSGEQRDDFNNGYQAITNGTANGNKGELELQYNYDSEKHESQIIYGENPVYGWTCEEHGNPDNEYKAWYPINDVYDQYLITSNTYNLYDGGINKIKSEDEIRQGDINVIDNINLGIYEREQPDLAIAKDLKDVKVTINGYHHIYKYANRFNNEELTNEMLGDNDKDRNNNGNGFNVGVKYQDNAPWSTQKYTRAIYKADYKWQNEGKNELEVYFVYQIKIKNTSSTLNATVNEIVDFYDKQYYDTEDQDINKKMPIYGGIEQYNEETGEIDSNMEAQLEGTTGKYNIMKLDTSNIFNNIEAGQTKDLFVEFKLSREKVEEILDVAERDENGNLTSVAKNENELDNITEITSYTTYKDGKIYAGIDEDSNPGTLLGEQDVENETVYEDDTDIAPPVRLEIAERREIRGAVFEDKTDLVEDKNSNGEGTGLNTRQGDGIYNDGEQPISGVQVKLYKASDTNFQDPVKVWDENEKAFKSTLDQNIRTDENGEFLIEGLIPDKYVVQYTWGDEKHPVQKYKATIFNKSAHQGEFWYEEINPRYSDAKDNYGQREDIDNSLKELNYDYMDKMDKTRTIDSTTPMFDAQIEYDYDTLSSTYEEEMQRKENSTDGIVYRIMNVDFGIAERPKQSVSLSKTINNIKLTLLDGEERINAKPIKETRKFEGSYNSSISFPSEDMIRLEMDNELIQGSTLEIEYALSARNTSEIDYVDQEWYEEGTLSENYKADKLVKLTLDRVNDYLDGDWGHEVETAWTEHKLEDLKGVIAEEILNNNETIRKQILLSSNSFGEISPTDSEPSTQSVKGIKVLTSGSDINLDNEAEVVKISKNGGGILEKDGISEAPGNFGPGTDINEPDAAKAERFFIIPNTGANLEFVTPAITIIVAFGILGIGIEVIRKLTQKNK